jgi:alpha-galactosidase/6-phospho-beta-glucosidase family protein
MEGLKGSTVCFMDIDKGRLKLVYGLAQRYADETNSDVSRRWKGRKRCGMQVS